MNAAVSAEYGLEAYTIQNHAYNAEEFCKLVDLITQKDPSFMGYLDNATCGKCTYTTNYLKERNIWFCYNIVREPILNSIERVFGQIKINFKRHRLQLYFQNKRAGMVRMVNYAIDKTKKSTIQKICRKGLKAF